MVKDCRQALTLTDVVFVASLGVLCVLLVWHPELQIQEWHRTGTFARHDCAKMRREWSVMESTQLGLQS